MYNFFMVLEHFLRDCQYSDYRTSDHQLNMRPCNMRYREDLFYSFWLSVSSKISKYLSFPSSKPFPFSFSPMLRFICLTYRPLFKRAVISLHLQCFRKNVSEILLCFWSVRAPHTWGLKVLLTHL